MLLVADANGLREKDSDSKRRKSGPQIVAEKRAVVNINQDEDGVVLGHVCKASA